MLSIKRGDGDCSRLNARCIEDFWTQIFAWPKELSIRKKIRITSAAQRGEK